MGAASLIKQGFKLADNLLDAGRRTFDPHTAPNVQDMTSTQIREELADFDDLPGWRKTDLERQLKVAEEVEELQQIRAAGDDRLNEISARDRDGVSNIPVPEHNPETNPLLENLWEDFLNPSPKSKERFNVEPLKPEFQPKPRVQKPKAPSSLFSDYNERGVRSAPWANQDEINRFKDTAKQLEQITGVKYDVDHYIPLRGDYVSGLHHQDNLFAMPSTQNRAKSNSFDMNEWSQVPDSAFRLTKSDDAARFLEQNRGLVQRRQEKKYDLSQEMSSALNRQIIDPATKVGRNAKKLWGDDYGRYVDHYKKELGLLGV